MRESESTGELAQLLEQIPIYQGHPLLDGAEDFELGEACELGDTDCESCQ